MLFFEPKTLYSTWKQIDNIEDPPFIPEAIKAKGKNLFVNLYAYLNINTPEKGSVAWPKIINNN